MTTRAEPSRTPIRLWHSGLTARSAVSGLWCHSGRRALHGAGHARRRLARLTAPVAVLETPLERRFDLLEVLEPLAFGTPPGGEMADQVWRHLWLPEREHVRLGAGLEQRDLQGSFVGHVVRRAGVGPHDLTPSSPTGPRSGSPHRGSTAVRSRRRKP